MIYGPMNVKQSFLFPSTDSKSQCHSILSNHLLFSLPILLVTSSTSSYTILSSSL